LKNTILNKEVRIKPHDFRGIHGLVSKAEISYFVSLIQCLIGLPTISDYYIRKRYKPYIPLNTQNQERKHKVTTFIKDFSRDMFSQEVQDVNSPSALDLPYVQ